MIDDKILVDAAAMAGELKKMLLALALVTLFAIVIIAIEAVRDRFGAACLSRWLALLALALVVGFAAAAF